MEKQRLNSKILYQPKEHSFLDHSSISLSIGMLDNNESTIEKEKENATPNVVHNKINIETNSPSSQCSSYLGGPRLNSLFDKYCK